MCFQQSERQRNACLQPERWPLKASSFPAWLGAWGSLLLWLARDLGWPLQPQPGTGRGTAARRVAEAQNFPVHVHSLHEEPGKWVSVDILAGQQRGRKGPDPELPCANSFGPNASCCLDKVQSHQVSRVYICHPPFSPHHMLGPHGSGLCTSPATIANIS